MPTLTKLYSMEEAAEHNTKDDCWVVIDGKVYDVTTYLDDHPGGDDVFFGAVGKDANEEFEDAGHSKSARELMETFLVGELDPSASTIPKLKTSSKDEPGEPKTSSKNEPGFVTKLKELPVEYWAVPLAAVGISVAVGFLYLKKK